MLINTVRIERNAATLLKTSKLKLENWSVAHDLKFDLVDNLSTGTNVVNRIVP